MRAPILLSAAAALTALCLGANTATAASLSPVGIWLDHTGRGAVEIKPCGKSLCGHVVWTRSKKDSKKGCGRKIIGRLKKTGSRTWDRGWIYSPERGQKYDLEVKPVNANKLRMLGYAGSKIFSKTMYWKRAPADLQRCDQPAAKPDTPIQAKKKPEKANVKTKTAKAEPAIVAPKPKSVERKTPPQQTKADVGKAPKAEQKVVSREPGTRTDSATTVDQSDDIVDRTTSAQDEVDAYQDSANTSEGAATTKKRELPNKDRAKKTKTKKKQVVRLKTKKKRCKINAPFITVSFPCKK